MHTEQSRWSAFPTSLSVNLFHFRFSFHFCRQSCSLAAGVAVGSVGKEELQSHSRPSKFRTIIALSRVRCRWPTEWDFNMAAVVISARVSIAEMFWTRWVIATTGWRTTHRLVRRNDVSLLYQVSPSNRLVCVRKPGFRGNRPSRWRLGRQST